MKFMKMYMRPLLGNPRHRNRRIVLLTQGIPFCSAKSLLVSTLYWHIHSK